MISIIELLGHGLGNILLGLLFAIAVLYVPLSVLYLLLLIGDKVSGMLKVKARKEHQQAIGLTIKP